MLKAINKIVLYVNDLKGSKDFYTKLGFELVTEHDKAMTMKVKGFELDFVKAGTETKTEFTKEADLEPRGAGIYILVEVEDIDKYFSDLKEKGIQISSEPRNWDWGRREFALRDIDGYKLVFYEKIN